MKLKRENLFLIFTAFYIYFIMALFESARGNFVPFFLEEFQITQPTLSYHMKILSESGLVNSRKDGVWMKYSINKTTLKLLKTLFDDISIDLMNSN